jgi:CRP-like cAMP-binding protein
LLPGCALRIRGDVLRDLFDGDEALRRLLLFYYQMRINHVSQRAVCHSRHRIQERLCTWLLMVHDRCDAERMPLTQESIARQLSVRRAGINECIGALHEAGLIEHTRASLKIINRDALERAACACYRTFAGEMSWHETFNGPRAA